MHGNDGVAATRGSARTTPIDRKTALKALGGALALLTSALLTRPAAVKADHDGT